MTRPLLLLFAVLFVAMIGFGITLPVLPLFVERLSPGVVQELVPFHVGALTSAYAVTQLGLAPLWGRWSDRYGRKPLVVAGLAGFALAQAAFGLGTSLPVLYGTRLLSGVFSAALLTAAAAYVADALPQERRSHGMAWMGTALSLGLVVGPVLGALLARRSWHVRIAESHLVVDGFSLPFVAAAGLALVMLPLIVVGLPESWPAPRAPALQAAARWSSLMRRLPDVLALVFFSQAALALFDAVFALYGDQVLALGLREIGYVLALCGLVMAAAQGGAVVWLTGRAPVRAQIGAGLGMLGAGLALLLWVHTFAAVLATVALLALGMALVTPNLLTLATHRSEQHVGAGLGLLNAASSFGQITGPLVGGLLFGWRASVPFAATAVSALLLAASVAACAGSRVTRPRALSAAPPTRRSRDGL